MSDAPSITGETHRAPETPRLATLLPPLTAQVLRGLWKERRDSYAQAHLYEEVRIRIHRALTWLAVAESRPQTETDTRLIELWAAASALFARWSAVAQQPLAERESTASFARQVLQWDRDGILPGVIAQLREGACAMWADVYLTRAQGMSIVAGEQSSRDPEVPAEDGAFLAGILERIGLTVRQLTLGAAAYGGSQNRAAVARSIDALTLVIPAVIQVITEHGYVDDWGALCSPPRTQ
ncbi:MAG: hypothetical protein EXS03_05385 [Phycisphaerales bacterium]|nr:hypothetical protein [Phycisphaerales bacterium]